MLSMIPLQFAIYFFCFCSKSILKGLHIYSIEYDGFYSTPLGSYPFASYTINIRPILGLSQSIRTSIHPYVLFGIYLETLYILP